MAQWKAPRLELLEPKFIEHRGRLMQLVGDELFIEFLSAVDAVRWAHRAGRGH